MRPVVLVGLFLSLSFQAMTEIVYREDMLPLIIQDIYEELTEEGKDVDFEQITEDLETLHQNPINLNNTSEEELQKLLFLSDRQIEEILILAYKQPLRSIYELKLVKGLKDYEIRNMLPFITVANVTKEETLSWKESLRNARHEASLRFDARNIENNGSDPFYLALKYRMNCNNRLQLGFAMERDPQEPFYAKGKTYGADFYGGFLQLQDIWKFKKIIIGDFKASFGEGLTINNGMNYEGKRAVIGSRGFRQEGINRKTSTAEYDFFRGAGATISLGLAEITAFYSARRVDGKNKDGVFPTIIKTGYHRTENELESKMKVWNHTAGANITFKLKKARIGITAAENIFSDTLRPENNYYNTYQFKGNRQFSAGLNYRWIEGKFTLFGEIATTQNKKWGIGNITGLSIQPTADFNFSVVYRYYSKRFDNLLANGIGESSRTNDENGLITGFDIKMVKNWNFAFYCDLFRFSSPKYGIKHPSYGFDVLYEMLYHPREYISMQWKLRAKEKYEKDKFTLRYSLDIRKGNWLCKSILEGNLCCSFINKGEVTPGCLIAQQADYSFKNIAAVLQLRLSAFYAKNYDNRFYVYENDVLYAFNIPSFYGIGGRMYLNFRYKISPKVSVYLKVSETLYAKKWADIQNLPKRHQTDIHTMLRITL